MSDATLWSVGEFERTVGRLDATTGSAFVREHHYSHGIHNGPMCYALRGTDDALEGVCAFATPNSEAVRGSIFGPGHVDRVTELHRLVLLDEAPPNSESWFIARALRALKADRPDLWAVVSFADGTEGHRGVIYQATNAIYYGCSPARRFYRDARGRLRHPRQNGHNVTLEEAAARGWEPVRREGKHRYLFLLPDNRSHRRALLRLLLVDPQPYPKDPRTPPLDRSADARH